MGNHPEPLRKAASSQSRSCAAETRNSIDLMDVARTLHAAVPGLVMLSPSLCLSSLASLCFSLYETRSRERETVVLTVTKFIEATARRWTA